MRHSALPRPQAPPGDPMGGRESRGHEDVGIVMRPEPFVSYTGQERISPDQDALLRTRQQRMGAVGDGKVDGGGRQCRGAFIQNEQGEE